MRRMRKSILVLIVTTLWLTWKPGSIPAQTAPSAPDSSWVANSLLREATARIDALDRQVLFLQNRAAETDSLTSSREAWWRGQVALTQEWGEHWRSTALSWWNRHESAFWTMLGMLVAALAVS